MAGTRGGSTAPAATTVVETPPATPDEETTWKARVARLRAANTVVAFGKPEHDYETLMAIRNPALTPYRTRLEEIRTALSGLPEEVPPNAGVPAGMGALKQGTAYPPG